MIKVYSRPSCAPCRALKFWLERKGIAYTELSPEGTDVTVVPTILIGEHRIVGLNYKLMAELLLVRQQPGQ